MQTTGNPPTLIRLDAARMLMRATDSRLRLGKRLYPERWLVKELSEVTPGVMGPPWVMCGVLGERLSISSGQRKARPRARGSTIYQRQRLESTQHKYTNCCTDRL